MSFGVVHGAKHGLAHGARHNGGSVFSTFTGFGLLFGDSNAVGAANFNATGQADTGYGVSNSVGYAPVNMRSLYATGVADPLTLVDTGTVTLRAYDIPGKLNMGQEQTLGRRLYQRGIAANPVIIKWAVSGSVQHTNWRSDSTSPITGGNMLSQCINFVKARQNEYGRTLDFAVYVLGENDTSSSTNANATQTDMGNTFAALRAGLGNPTLPIFVMQMNTATTGAFASTVSSQQIAYIATDPYCRGVYTSDIPLASNPHYGANGYYDLGDRVAHAVAKYFFPTRNFYLPGAGSGSAPWLQDFGSGVTIAVTPATGTPRPGPDEKDGDLQLLVMSSQAIDTTYTLNTAAGFTAVAAKNQSIFSGTNYRTMQVWWRLVDQATLDANGGRMPCPVVDGGATPTNLARIITIRGPNKFTVNPIDQYTVGANNGNTTALSIAGGTTLTANQLAIILCSVPGAGASVSACTNGSFAGITKQFDSRYTQTTTIGLALHTATIASAGAFGATSITMSATGNNVGCILTIKP